MQRKLVSSIFALTMYKFYLKLNVNANFQSFTSHCYEKCNDKILHLKSPNTKNNSVNFLLLFEHLKKPCKNGHMFN